MKITGISILVFSLSVLPTVQAADIRSDYIGQENRAIKALSPRDIQGYRMGKGMGFAKAAELNGYPGPRHTLDTAKKIQLSDSQLLKTQNLFKRMQKESIDIGKLIIKQEKQLDLLFARKIIDHASLKRITASIAILKGKLRFVHLSAHLEQKTLLTTRQVHQYNRLRGYSSKHKHQH